MFSCFKSVLKPKTAAKRNKGIARDREGKREVQPALPSQSSASERFRDNNPDNSVPRLSRRSRNLWQEAFAKLDDAQQDLLSSIENPQGPSVVQIVADETEKRYRECHKRGWKISRGKGKSDINLRAAAEKILTSVLWFKKLIDAGVAFDPTGHWASAWTIVSLGLQIAQNDVDRLQALLEASGTLTDTLTRCAAIEASYRDRDLPDSDHLEDTIVGVYVAILEFSAEIVSQNRMKIVRRVLISIHSLAEQPLQDLNAKLNSRDENLRRWTKMIEHQYRKLEIKEIDEKISSTLDEIEDMTQQLSTIKSKMLSAEEHDVLKWLSEYDYSASHKSAASQRESDTGAWILKNSQYREWKTSDCSLLWLYGNSGSGKTVLCSNIVDDLQKLCVEDSSYALAYWYFTFSIQSSLDIDNLLYSIMRQLCAKTETLPENIRELWRINRAAGSRPTRAISMEVLDSLISDLKIANQNVLVVLDALDEYPLLSEPGSSDLQQTSGRKDVLLWLRKFCAKHENAHVMVVSRDEKDIRHALIEASKVDVAKCVVGDLQLFIPNCIDRIVEEHRWKAQYRAAMSSRIEGISEKRFRWASLMQRRFSECLDHETMQQALETLPDSLEAMYADVLMRRIPKHYREKARLMLMWLTYSIRPLRLRELAFVAALPEPMDVCRICTSSLVTLSREVVGSSKQSVRASWCEPPSLHDFEEDIIKFDHFSVKEYMTSETWLASSRDPASYFFVPPLLAHLSIAQLSVSHLLDTNGSHFTVEDNYVKPREAFHGKADGWSENDINVDSKGDVAVQRWLDFPLLEYSTFWHEHVREADAIESRLAPVDLTKPNLRELKAQAQSTVSQAEESRTQIHRLFCDTFSQSFRNWALLLKHLTREIPYTLTGVPPAIWYASLLNLPDSVRRLLPPDMVFDGSINSDCFSDRQPEYERTPVQIAAIHGNTKVLSLLLETNVHVEQSELGYLMECFERHGDAVLNIILEARPYLTMKDLMVKRAWICSVQHEVYRYILESPGVFSLSKELFEFIVKKFNWNRRPLAVDVGLVETIQRRGDDIGYGRGEMAEASVQDEELERDLEVVIDRHKTSSISQNVLALMVANEACGTDMLAIVLDHYKDVRLSQNLMKLMLANSICGANMLALVLKHFQGIQISQDLLVAAASNNGSGYGRLFGLILEYDENIVVSEDTLKAAAGNYLNGEEIFSAILSRRNEIEVSEDTLKAAATLGEPKIFSVILSHNKDLEISEDTLKVAAKEPKGPKIFSIVLSHNNKIDISEDILKVAATNEWNGEDVFWVILNNKEDIVISLDIMGAIAENHKRCKDIINILIDHESCEVHSNFKSREEMLSNSAYRGYHFHRCKFKISQEMTEAAARWEPSAIDFLMAHRRSNVTFVRSTTQVTPSDSKS